MSNHAPQPTPPVPWTPPSPLPVAFQTERLTIRFPGAPDADGFFEMISSSRASFAPWLPWAETEHVAVEQTMYFIEKFRRTRTEPGATDFTMGIFDRATGRPLGGTGLHRVVPNTYEGEIGYYVRADAQNKGICTEATRGLITWALTPQDQGGWGLRRIHIRCAARNLASQRVPRKLGLREEARLVQERWTPGLGWEDTLVWGVLNDEWDGHAPTTSSRS